MSTVARPSKGPSQKKILVNKTEMSIIIGVAEECQQITDQNQWTTVRTGDKVKAQFPCIFAGLLKHPGTQGNVVPPAVCLALPLSASSSRVSTATTQPMSSSKDKTRTFSSSSSRKNSESSQELSGRYRSSWLKKYMWVLRGNGAIPTKWRTGSSRRCVGGSRHIVDWSSHDSCRAVPWKCSLMLNDFGWHHTRRIDWLYSCRPVEAWLNDFFHVRPNWRNS